MQQVNLSLGDESGTVGEPFMAFFVPTDKLAGFLMSVRQMQQYIPFRVLIGGYLVTTLVVTREGTKLKGYRLPEEPV